MKKSWKHVQEIVERYILLKNQPLMIKLGVFSTILVILPVLSVGIASYNSSAIHLEEETRRSSRQIIYQVEMQIENYMHDFEIASLKIINSSVFIPYLKSTSIYRGYLGYSAEPVRHVLKEAQYSRADITNITVYMDNGFVVDTLKDRNYYPVTKMKDEYWFHSVPNNGMVLLVSRTLKLKDQEIPVISLIRRLYNPETLKPVGMLIIDINFKRIKEISDMVTVSKTGTFFILDSKGHYVYHPDFTKLGKRIEYEELLYVNGSGSTLLDNDREDFIAYSHSSNLGWSFFTAVPYDELTGGNKEIAMVITTTILIALFFAYTIGFLFSKRLVRPIRKLQQFMKDVEIGNLSGSVGVESNDEIGQLTHGFNKTVSKLSKLLDEVYVSKLREAELSLKQKEIEIKMLQSQMNPHFLYNSLETIRGMALEEDKENIARMSLLLGKLLRYNLRNNSATVTLGEEIRFCEMFLQIQKVRFEDRFEYEVTIPKWAVDLQVIKFSLQPLVENCFVHSFGEDVGKIKIQLSVIRVNDFSFAIKISDTGAGIHKEKLEKLTAKIKQNLPSLDGNHIGIINVHQRIQYIFGSQYGIKIDSAKGNGTQVTIHLPMQKQSEGDLLEKSIVG
ncbi:sensor histidine kinase [Bacillus sp. EB01]|uniref:sensor histidine kinase n=1 Tax=Bacillus sp. EB01 TaxID=1347086 RepID=UPI0005C680B3|nr:histidine kinase [Bacillus sp. EB01]